MPIGLELTFDTAGIPYQWRRSTRYEIPCRVTGTVRVGDEEIAFAGPGQRDHSWGARDWWASDWMWSALHLDDGTHTHAVGVPQVPKFAVGYVQRDGRIAEVTSVRTTEEVAADGLVSRATIASGPDPELELARRAAGLRPGPAGRARRPRVALRAGDVPDRGRRRPRGPRLGGVEPQPEGVVGTAGFEPATPSPQTRRDTRLRHIPRRELVPALH